MTTDTLPIIDAHVHFVDAELFRYPTFVARAALFERLFGDYSALRRRYLPQDYFKDVAGFNVVGTVWVSGSAHLQRNGTQEIALADIDTTMTQDRVGGRTVKIEVRQHEMVKIVVTFHAALFLAAEWKRDFLFG